MKINWAIICYIDAKEGGLDVLHVCGYGDKPSQGSIDSLIEELQTDPEFEMIDVDYEMLLINRETGGKYFEMLEIPESMEQ